MGVAHNLFLRACVNTDTAADSEIDGAKAAVEGPAIFLIVVSSMGLAMQAIYLVLYALGMAAGLARIIHDRTSLGALR
jgi:hypothetical protein